MNIPGEGWSHRQQEINHSRNTSVQAAQVGLKTRPASAALLVVRLLISYGEGGVLTKRDSREPSRALKHSKAAAETGTCISKSSSSRAPEMHVHGCRSAAFQVFSM